VRVGCGGVEEFPLEQTTLIKPSYPGKSAPLPSSLNAGISGVQAKNAKPWNTVLEGALVFFTMMSDMGKARPKSIGHLNAPQSDLRN